ncbi:MAG: type III pantothenate kinase [Deltaproteobacteria bacterium]|nr:type III pantothenate kinase [Deltaproteobacteria bacterium]
MFLSCDIGNTNTVLGIYKNLNGNYDDDEDIFKVYRISTSQIYSDKDIFYVLSKLFSGDSISINDVKNACISSVVPPQNKFYESFCKLLDCNVIFISSASKTDINILVENPEKLGSDRLVNAGYAYHLHKEFQIIVDIGTALTIDIIDENGNFKGGVIFPGIKMLAVCLNEKTAALPLIDVDAVIYNSDNYNYKNIITPIPSTPTIPLIGNNTVKSIQSGLLYGTIFLIEGFIKEIQAQYNKKECKVIFTGGLSNIIADKCKIKGLKIIDDLWTIKGLKFLYQLNTF